MINLKFYKKNCKTAVIKYNNNVLFAGLYVWKITYGYIYKCILLHTMNG